MVEWLSGLVVRVVRVSPANPNIELVVTEPLGFAGLTPTYHLT
jgi:hypothetical protein